VRIPHSRQRSESVKDLGRKVLDGLLATRSSTLCPQIKLELASNDLEYATYHNTESWDGYLISQAKSLGTSTLYSLDKRLSKVKGISVVNPFTEEAV
jgi:predicted nucleic acid-binding protein